MLNAYAVLRCVSNTLRSLSGTFGIHFVNILLSFSVEYQKMHKLVIRYYRSMNISNLGDR